MMSRSCSIYFNRANLKQLLKNLNCQKDVIKKHGIFVDGKKYNVTFTVIVYSFQFSCCKYNNSITQPYIHVQCSHTSSKTSNMIKIISLPRG